MPIWTSRCSRGCRWSTLVLIMMKNQSKAQIITPSSGHMLVALGWVKFHNFSPCRPLPAGTEYGCLAAFLSLFTYSQRDSIYNQIQTPPSHPISKLYFDITPPSILATPSAWYFPFRFRDHHSAYETCRSNIYFCLFSSCMVVGEWTSCVESWNWAPALPGRYYFSHQIWSKESNHSGCGQHPAPDHSASRTCFWSEHVRVILLLLIWTIICFIVL